jgi:hypothetical protein
VAALEQQQKSQFFMGKLSMCQYEGKNKRQRVEEVGRNNGKRYASPDWQSWTSNL